LLGFQWSDINASGLKALTWRFEWERSKDSNLKQKLVTYNAEDCEALEKVTDIVVQLCQRQTEAATSRDDNIVHADSLKRADHRCFKRNEFVIPELEYINQAAYWDYQREKIYVRLSKRLRRISRKKTQNRAKVLPVNKVIKYLPPGNCPKCQATKIRKLNKIAERIYDLKFNRAGVKRWIVMHVFHRYSCYQCGAIFYSWQKPGTENKYGPNLLAYIIYQIIELHVTQRPVGQNLNQLFGINISRSELNRQKARFAQLYKETYVGILDKIVNGRLLHADETKASVEGESA
jgi:hypothetical protein